MTRPLPHSLPAERSLLGSIMVDNSIVDDVRDLVTGADFFEPAHSEVWRMILDMRDADRAISPLTLLADWTQDRPIGHGLTASEYLYRLPEEAVPAEAAKEVARGVYNNALKRRMIATANALIDDAFEAPVSMSADYLRDKYDTAFGELFPTMKALGVQHIADYGDAVVSRVETFLKQGDEAGLPIGLTAIQDLTGPLMPGRLYSLAGASGSGKSALAQQALKFMCNSVAGLWVQAEMEGEEVAARGISELSGVSGEAIERALVNDADFGSILDASKELRHQTIYIDAGTRPTVARIRSRASRMKRSMNLGVIVVDDLLHLATPSPKMGRIEAIPDNMQDLKSMAKDLHVPVVVLMPLKSVYHEGGNVRRPRMEDLTHPAAIDQASDVVLFIHRPEYILGRNPVEEKDKGFTEWQLAMDAWKGKAEAILAKRRGGKGFGVRTLYYDATRFRFSDREPRSSAPNQGFQF